MHINEADITEFQELYKSKLGLQIDRQTAREKLTLLVRQMEIVYQPITKKQYDTHMAASMPKLCRLAASDHSPQSCNDCCQQQ